MKRFLNTAVLTAALVLVPACGSMPQRLASVITPDNAERTELVIRIAASQYIEAGSSSGGFQDRAVRVRTAVDKLLDTLDTFDRQPIPTLIATFKDDIGFSTLTVADQILVEALVDNVLLQLDSSLEDGFLGADTKVALRTILNTIGDVARLYAL